MKLVNDFGDIVRMTNKRFGDFISAGVRGEQPNPRNYGSTVGTIDFTSTDASVTEFAMMEIEQDRRDKVK